MPVAGDLSWPLTHAARLHGAAPAVTYAQRTVTYAELARRVGGLGASLDVLGLPAGARIGVLAANSLAHVECFLGIPAYARVIVDLNFRLAEDELVFLAQDAGIELLVTDTERLEVARVIRERCPQLREIVHDGAGCPDDCVEYEELVAAAPAQPPGTGEHELAAISYTGGTTGRPKGVMLSHGNLLANARHNLLATGHSAEDRWLHVCPMFHVAGTANVLAATWVGATQVVLPRFDAELVATAIERDRITHMVLVPTMLGMLLDHDAAGTRDFSSLRHVQYAASPIAWQLQRRVLDRFDCDVAQFYGMTEAAPTVTHCTPRDHRLGQAGEEPYRTRLASMGAAVVGVQVDVRDGEGQPVAIGEIGEVWVRGPNVMLGYWKQPEATEDALVDGWYRSGDAAYADADGYLYMVDRLKDMIITGAENVYCVEIERALAEHPAVLEAAVFGIPDDRWGEAVHAVVAVARQSSLEAEELIAHCRRLIAGFKVPRSIDIRTDPLPKSGAGKVLKNRLRDPFWAGRERWVS
jgi:long-chain acyl-CoA synthetase